MELLLHCELETIISSFIVHYHTEYIGMEVPNNYLPFY